jgi:hypothetical protein
LIEKIPLKLKLKTPLYKIISYKMNNITYQYNRLQQQHAELQERDFKRKFMIGWLLFVFILYMTESHALIGLIKELNFLLICYEIIKILLF